MLFCEIYRSSYGSISFRKNFTSSNVAYSLDEYYSHYFRDNKNFPIQIMFIWGYIQTVYNSY